MNILSTIWGIGTLLLALIFMIPFLGWLNWLIIPVAVIGIIMGAFSDRKGGMYLNIVALILAFFRLIIGGGIL